MHAGVLVFTTPSTVPPDELARLAEGAGCESIWVPDHSHVPADASSGFRYGGKVPDAYREMFDPFVALAAAAGATRHLRLGTAVCLVSERDPITTAKAVASLDQLSAGRVLFGVGPGWNAEELANHGTAFEQRFAVTRERTEAIRRLWVDQVVSHDGEHVSLRGAQLGPRPVQRPHPPVLVAGNGPTVLDRVLAYGDGWIPAARHGGHREICRAVRELADRCAVRGRPTMPTTVVGAPVDRDVLADLAGAGVERVVFFGSTSATNDGGPSPDLDPDRFQRWATMVAELAASS